jgi:hypothetical protein
VLGCVQELVLVGCGSMQPLTKAGCLQQHTRIDLPCVITAVYGPACSLQGVLYFSSGCWARPASRSTAMARTASTCRFPQDLMQIAS